MSSVFFPTPPELAVVSQIFSQADPLKTGVLAGDVAVRVFDGAKLPPTTLRTIWNISDEDDKGLLHKRGVAIAVRLIGWAQNGEEINKDLVKKPGPLAVIEGINTVSQQNTGMTLPRSPPLTPYPPLTARDKARFHSMFMKNNPVNSLLSGKKVRDIFDKSKLSNKQLMKIWNLADTQARGALDSTDFAIGMYFIKGVMSNKISFIPISLPPGLYHQAGGGQEPFGPVAVKSHISGNSGSFSPVVGSFQQPRSFAHSNHDGYAPAWDVSPTKKAYFDRLFDIFDSEKRGYIEEKVAVPFMVESKLPGEVLTQIWDLVDINSDGRLTRDGFAIAIHLIQKKLAGQDVPSKLPPSLIPPSARVSALGTSPFSPANAESHQEPEPTTDLFLFDDAPPYSPLSQQPPNIFGDGSDLSALLVEKTEIEGALLRDKEEARELHKRMIEMDKHVEALKADVEKEAKQQKGLLAIVRKQLSTKESEKVKAEREHAEAVEELSSITGEKDTVDAELAIMTSLEPKVAQRTLSSDSLASQPIPMTPDNGPDLLALPPVKSNNPFERLAMSSLLLRRSPSPSIQGSKLPGSDLLPVAASSTFNSFSAVQTPANPKSSQPSGETMGKMPASVTPVNFSFDPGFDDGFDFASESASKTLEIEIQDLNKTTQQVEFDDTGPSTPFYLPPPYKDRTSRTFDSVFASAGFGSSPVLKVEDKPIIDSPPVLSRSDEPSISGFFPQPPSLTPVRYPQFRSSSVLYRSDEPQASMSGFLPQPPSLTPGRYPQFRSSSVLYRSDEPSISGSFPEPPSLTSGRYPQFRSSSVLSRSDEPSMSGFFPEPRSLTQSPQRRSSSVLYRSDEPSTSRFFPEPRSLTQSPQRRSSSVLYRSDEPSTSGFFSQPPSLRSPQPRSSSSSTSKDIHDKPKEPLAHHSKLGTRLLRKKKKQQEPMLLP